jgi:hypothetical protein
MLHPLPFTTFGEIARLGLEVHVSCSRCYDPRRISLDDDRLLARPFAGTRFICTKARWNGETCGGLGHIYVKPQERLTVGVPLTLAFLFCRRCVPSWQIDQVQLDRPPWSETRAEMKTGRPLPLFSMSWPRRLALPWPGMAANLFRRRGSYCCRPASVRLTECRPPEMMSQSLSTA